MIVSDDGGGFCWRIWNILPVSWTCAYVTVRDKFVLVTGRFRERKYNIYVREHYQFPVYKLAANERWEILLTCMKENQQILVLRTLFTEEKSSFLKNKRDRTFSVEQVTIIWIVQVNCDGKPHFNPCILPSNLLQIICWLLDPGGQNFTASKEIYTEGYNHHHNHHKRQGLDHFDPFRLQSYNCSRQQFFGLPIVLLPCGL